MKLENYSPTSRNVLLREVKDNENGGGILLPSTEFITENNDKIYTVIKVGKDCTEVRPGDAVKLMKGIIVEKFELEHDGTLPVETDEEISSKEWSFVK